MLDARSSTRAQRPFSRAVPVREVAQRVWAPSKRRGPWRAIRRLAALVCCAGLASAEPASAEWSPSEAYRGEVVLVGSSSFNQAFGHIVAHEIERWGFQVTRKGVSGAGLARPDYRDMYQVLESLPIGATTAAVVVYLGVNDAQSLWLQPHERVGQGLESLPFGSAAWETAYARRARDFYERICQRGAQRAIVLLPVDVNRPALRRRLVRIRALQEQAAAESSCAVAVSTAGDVGQFEVDGVAKRLPDGYHMSSQGARIVWQRIRGQVLELLSAPPPTRVARADDS